MAVTAFHAGGAEAPRVQPAPAVEALAQPPAPVPSPEYEAARARCTALLSKINAVVIPKETIADGSCGSLAPVELVSVGKNPQVVLSPPAILNCDMVVAVHDWVKSDIQPLARKHFGREIVRIEVMGSYSCRNAYGRRLSKLSEHGKANALDIRGFVTAKGETAYVLADWGMTSGEIRAAAVKATKEQAEREVAAAANAQEKARVAAAAKASHSATASAQLPSGNPIAGASTLMEGLPNAALSIGGGILPSRPAMPDVGLAPPNRLGGPKKKDAEPGQPAAYAAPDASARSLFLREAHAAACRRFETTLGPEANAAHRNHMHIDLAERKSKAICE